MLRRLLFPVLLASLAFRVLPGADPVEREEHFDVIRLLIDKSLRLPARRAIEAYKNAGYANDNFYVKGLEFYFADVFRSLVADRTRSAELEEQYKSLRNYLEGNKEQLPSCVARLLETSSSIKKYTSALAQEMNPDSPPPLPQAKWTDVEAREFYAKLQRMLEVADKALDKKYALIEAHKEQEQRFDLGEEERQKVDKEGTFLRYHYCEILYPVYQVARDIAMRGDAFGLEPRARELVERWFHDKLQRHGEEFSIWDWNFGIYFPFLRHRLNVIRSEVLRLNIHRADLGKIDADTAYEDVKRQLQEVADTDLELYEDAETKRSVDYLKLVAWSDLLHWHLALGEDRYLETGIELWEKFKERPYTLKYADNVYKEYLVGHIYILGARLYHAFGNFPHRDALLAEVKGADNYLSDNAQLWINFFNSGPGEAWTKQPTAMPPEAALNLAVAMWSKYNESIDAEERRRFGLKAIANLRNGIKGLPEDGSPEFLSFAPRLYQLYSVFLYKLGWHYHASLVAQDGLERFQPYWESENDNEWLDEDGQLSESGGQVRQLANNFLNFATVLKSRADSRYANLLVKSALDLLGRYDKAAAQDREWWQVLIAMQNGEYEEAIRLANAYARSRPKQQVKAKGIVVLAWYRRLEEAVKEEDEDRIGEYGAGLDAALDDIVPILEPVIKGEEEAPEGQERQYREQWNTVLSIKVARLMKEKRYDGVFALLDDDFWRAPPPDRRLHRQMVVNLAYAAYETVKKVVADAELKVDAERFFANWEHFVRARREFRNLLKKYPTLKGARVRNVRKALGQVFNVCKDQSDFFLRAIRNEREGYADLDAKRMERITVVARLFYADVLVIDEETKPAIILSIGNSLWKIVEEGDADCLTEIVGDEEDPVKARRAFLRRLEERCAEIYEQYLAILEGDSEIRGFRLNPEAYLDRFRTRFSRRSELARFWNPEKKGSLYDLLYDRPVFLENEYKNRTISEENWSEAKADYYLAHAKLAEFDEVFQRVVGMVSNRETWQEEKERLDYVVNGLANLILVKSRLVDIYKKSTEPEHLNRAVELSRDLYRYDPMSPGFMSMYVEGTIRAIKNPPAPPDEQVKEARLVAIKIRELVKDNIARFAEEYWLSFCQILEISKYLGEDDQVRTALRRKVRAEQDPPIHLVVPGTTRAQSPKAVDIAKRFLALFDTEGVNLEKPYRIEMDKKGVVHFLREGQNLQEGAPPTDDAAAADEAEGDGGGPGDDQGDAAGEAEVDGDGADADEEGE